MSLWNEFITAFSPFFDDFFGMVNEILAIFFNNGVDVNGLPTGLSLFGVPLIMFVLVGILFSSLLSIIFRGKDND